MYPSGADQLPAMKTEIVDLLPTRQSLLGRLKDWEDREGWQDFFNTYWKLIYQVALKAGLNDPEAQDVVQETMIAVAKAIPSLQYDASIGSFKGWLLTITRRRIADHFRSKQRHPTACVPPSDDESSATPLLSRIPDADACWDSLWNEEWERNFLEVALENVKQKVKSRQYQLFDCFVLKQWPNERDSAQARSQHGPGLLCQIQSHAPGRTRTAPAQSAG